MTWRMRQVLVVCLVMAIASSAASMVYANRVAREGERRWCGVITTLDDAYRVTPPQTPAGRDLASDIRRLRAEFRC